MTHLDIDLVVKGLIDAFHAGEAYAVGSHKDFKQIHPNCGEYVSKTTKSLLKGVE
jgi:hypothetical protein